MTFSNPVVAAGVAGLAALYADRVVTPVEACEIYLSRIEGLDGALGSILVLDADGARAAAHASAERRRREQPLSPLDGTPVLIDAAYAAEGLAGVRGAAPIDAPLVARLRAGGAVILGLTVSDLDAAARSTHNPWCFDAPTRGGAAAVAAGFCAAAVGVEAVAELAQAAAASGLVAHKPTPGIVAFEGVAAAGWTFDQPAVLARSPRDAGRLFAGLCCADADLAAELAEPSGLEALTQAPLAWLDAAGAQTPAATRMLGVARAAGLDVEPLVIAGLDRAPLWTAARFVHACERAALADAAESAGEPFTRSARDLALAYRTLADAAEAVRDALSGYAALLAPGPEAALLAALAGLPATAFPVGLDPAGRPLGAAVAAWDDETTLGLARLLSVDLGSPPDYRG